MVYFNACFHRIYSKYCHQSFYILSKDLPLLPIGEGKKLCKCIPIKMSFTGIRFVKLTALTITALVKSCWRWLPYIFKVNYEIYMHILWCGKVLTAILIICTCSYVLMSEDPGYRVTL